ncbi:methyltransferase domain-containing protein [Lacihabitans soyangensis]|uniref:Class I SAM-dependent methyltransferase n=1 Tax=Lacihabitans soyangensis TaxID=869394 RepID=A0AAE3GYF0_9BACT|nr:methyltransferase domain-containing protein [Lacihabitans soyangensis]MCP9761584.1 class I SAM-dependent methyltransferase [Lacihabitans soyangensis]
MSLYKKIGNKIKSTLGVPFLSFLLPNAYFYSRRGTCSCCEKKVIFYSYNDYLRSNYICQNCNSLPRERALMQAIERFYPNWRNLNIHESSPIERGASVKINKGNKNYTASQFFPNHPFGELVNGVRNENLENQKFQKEVFDLVITQDVFEHLNQPEKAFAEIHRTLKKGGAHILTVPIENRFDPTVRWAELDSKGNLIFLFTPEYHGNPVNEEGSPVFWHYGYDIVEMIEKSTGVKPYIQTWEDRDNGIEGLLNEIIVIKKV